MAGAIEMVTADRASFASCLALESFSGGGNFSRNDLRPWRQESNRREARLSHYCRVRISLCVIGVDALYRRKSNQVAVNGTRSSTLNCSNNTGDETRRHLCFDKGKTYCYVQKFKVLIGSISTVLLFPDDLRLAHLDAVLKCKEDPSNIYCNFK